MGNVTFDEYRSEENNFPPLFTKVPPSESVSYDVWWQLRQTILVNRILKKGQAAGGIVVFNMSYNRLAGLYTFPVMPLYNMPTLYMYRAAGAKVLKDAKEGKKATIKLLAKVEPTETYQLIGYLPRRNYGTEKDEKILLITHTDGPAILQDNGALGLLGIIAYFSHIPQAERPRTLMLYLDNRYYMPGMERAKVEPSFLWTRNNQSLIDMGIKAVKEHKWPRVMVQCVERPGIHGGHQGVWYGMRRIALKLNLPAFATMGTQGAYWTTTSRIKDFNKNLFCTQVAAMAQLTGELMKADIK